MKTSSMRLLFALFLTLMLTIISMPDQLALIRPLWVLLFVLYLQVAVPASFTVTGVAILGITLDVLCASPMGQHVFALALAAWCISGRAKRFKFFSITQQMAWVLLLGLIYQSTLHLLSFILGYPFGLWAMLLPVCMTTLIWPWIRLVADRWLLIPVR